MPKPTKGDKEPGEGGAEQKRPPQEAEPKLGNPDANPQRIHREYLERHLGGGAPATSEAYARALEQWRQLPGAVTTSPTQINKIKKEDDDAPAKKEDETQSKNDAKDEEKSE